MRGLYLQVQSILGQRPSREINLRKELDRLGLTHRIESVEQLTIYLTICGASDQLLGTCEGI